MTDQELCGRLLAPPDGTTERYQQWFFKTFRRLCRKVSDPLELARRLTAVQDAR